MTDAPEVATPPAPVPRGGSMVPGIDTPWLFVDEAAAYLRMSPQTLKPLLQSGEIVGRQSRRGGRWRIRKEALDAYMDGVPYVPPTPARVARR